MLAVGMGCDRGAPLASVEFALDQALAVIGAQRSDIAVFASIDKKHDEIAFIQIGTQESKRWRFFSADELSRVAVPNPSETVRRLMGTPAVAEAAALLAANTDASGLLVEKYKYRGDDGKHVTVSLARMTT